MPELPEVITVINDLKVKITKHVLEDVKVFYNKLTNDDLSILKDQELINITNWGKYLLFRFGPYYLIVHLRMTGKFFIKDLNYQKTTHDQALFYFDNFVLVFNDVRKFGKMYLRKGIGDLFNTYPLNEVEVDPFNIEPNKLYESIKNSKRVIKAVLLDQSLISGIGNIYADEILFASKILPTRASNTLTLNDIETIITNAKVVLNKAIENHGTTIQSFSSLGHIGNNQNYLLVHTKEGLPCPICGNIIKKTKVASRGTYYCEKCQK